MMMKLFKRMQWGTQQEKGAEVICQPSRESRWSSILTTGTKALPSLSVTAQASRLILVASLLIQSSASAGLKEIRMAITTEPPNLNSMKATDQSSFFVLGHVMEGLTRVGKNGEAVPGVAEKWEINDKTATFYLRKDAKWSDGKPVTARDFVFSWRTTLDPKTASEYAFILYHLKNAEAINKGTVPVTELGAVAESDTKLKITFEKPCGYFLGLTSFATYFPVREDFFNTKKDRYAANFDDMIYNGPFKLTSWVHGASLVMDKNPNYWGSSNIKLDRISIPYITPDNSARFNFYKDKKTDLLERLSKDDLPKAQAEKMKIKSFMDGSIWFMEFNFREGRPTRSKHLRKAIQLVFNPSELVSRVIGVPGTAPGLGLIPRWVRGNKDLFRKEFPMSPVKVDVKKAKEELQLAMKELGVSKIPPLVWLTGDTPTSSKEAEYFQNVFKTQLGLELKIDKQIFKQRLAKMTSGDFDIVSAGWGPDYADPMTFADLMTSWNENNRGRYQNPEYDRLIRVAMGTSDSKQRMDAMSKAERIAMDELAVLPTYERSIAYVISDRAQGVQRRVIGHDPDFTFATVND